MRVPRAAPSAARLRRWCGAIIASTTVPPSSWLRPRLSWRALASLRADRPLLTDASALADRARFSGRPLQSLGARRALWPRRALLAVQAGRPGRARRLQTRLQISDAGDQSDDLSFERSVARRQLAGGLTDSLGDMIPNDRRKTRGDCADGGMIQRVARNWRNSQLASCATATSSSSEAG